jgi:hypothetical protein
MLAIPTQFPAAGSLGFLAPKADPVRIMRRNADGTLLLSLDRTGASGTVTAPADDVYETAHDAFAPANRSRAAAPWRAVVTTTKITGRGRLAKRRQILECRHTYVIKGRKACIEAATVLRRKCRECGE